MLTQYKVLFTCQTLRLVTCNTTFDEDTNKVTGFVTVCKLYIRIRIKKVLVKKQYQYIYTESW